MSAGGRLSFKEMSPGDLAGPPGLSSYGATPALKTNWAFGLVFSPRAKNTLVVFSVVFRGGGQ
jgi:hypothetical protein